MQKNCYDEQSNAFGNALGNSIVEGMSAEKDLTAAEQKAINDRANKSINLDKLGNIDEPMADIAKSTTAGAEKESTNSINKTGQAQRDKFDADFEVAQVVRSQKESQRRSDTVSYKQNLDADLSSKKVSVPLVDEWVYQNTFKPEIQLPNILSDGCDLEQNILLDTEWVRDPVLNDPRMLKTENLTSADELYQKLNNTRYAETTSTSDFENVVLSMLGGAADSNVPAAQLLNTGLVSKGDLTYYATLVDKRSFSSLFMEPASQLPNSWDINSETNMDSSRSLKRGVVSAVDALSTGAHKYANVSREIALGNDRVTTIDFYRDSTGVNHADVSGHFKYSLNPAPGYYPKEHVNQAVYLSPLQAAYRIGIPESGNGTPYIRPRGFFE